MSNYEEHLVLATPSNQEFLAFKLEAIAKEMRNIPETASYPQAMSMKAAIEFIERLDAIKHG